jgi:hypothetical protein
MCFNEKIAELRRKYGGQIKPMGKNVGEQREGVKCMTGIKKGRKRLTMKIWKKLFPVDF